jgi:drug/metabolite transporter (DMT)-like permease
MNMCIFTMYFANSAGINVGVITTITSINPFFTALVDYLVYKIILKYYHFVGMVSIVLGSVFICLNGTFDAKKEDALAVHSIPTWVPVLTAFFQPFGYTAWAMLAKHLTSERIGFDAMNVTFSTISTVNFCVLIGSLFYFGHFGEFDTYLFTIGLVGSFLDTLGIVFITRAFSSGPAGLISALATSTNLFLTILEAIKHHRGLSKMESFGLLLGIYGALVLALPSFFEKFCFCFCVKKK